MVVGALSPSVGIEYIDRSTPFAVVSLLARVGKAPGAVALAVKVASAAASVAWAWAAAWRRAGDRP